MGPNREPSQLSRMAHQDKVGFAARSPRPDAITFQVIIEDFEVPLPGQPEGRQFKSDSRNQKSPLSQ